MKRFLVFMILLLPLPARTQRAVEFGEFFIDRTMRIDYYHVTDRTFFSVNEQAIIRVIDYYSR